MRNLQDFKNWLNEDESRKAGIEWEEVFTFADNMLKNINQRYQTHKINDLVLFSSFFLPDNGWLCWDYKKDKSPIWTTIWKWVEEKEKQDKSEARKNFFNWLTQNYEYANDYLLVWERLIDIFDILLFTEELKYREKSLTSESLNLVSEWKDKENGLISKHLKIVAKYIKKEIERINNECRHYYCNYCEYSEEVENFFKGLIDYVSSLEKDNKIKKLESRLNHQLSWKTKIKHLTLGGLMVLGSKETYNWYQGESKNNLMLSPISNSTWLDNVYLNIPFNEPEYKNLTNLLEFSQVEKEKKNLAEISNILFSDFSNNFYDLKIEITRLKISELVIQIPTKKTELEKKITNTKNKLGKAEKYLFEKLLAEKPNSEKLSELKEVLSEYQSEIENILTNQQEINNLENHLEYLQELQTNQLEAKIEINYN